jgi:uncharacterized membrane protein
MVQAESENLASPDDRRIVLAVFEETDEAIAALNGLRDDGFTADQVSVVARDEVTTREMADNSELISEEAGKGAIVGTLLGGLAGWLIGLSSLAIPGIGPVIGAGIIGTALAGAGIGAAAGGLIGALGAYGIPEEDARGYEEDVRQGRVLLTVHAADDAQTQRANTILAETGGQRVRSYDGAGAYIEPPGSGHAS